MSRMKWDGTELGWAAPVQQGSSFPEEVEVLCRVASALDTKQQPSARSSSASPLTCPGPPLHTTLLSHKDRKWRRKSTFSEPRKQSKTQSLVEGE